MDLTPIEDLITEDFGAIGTPGQGVAKAIGIFPEGPVGGVFVHVGPMEASAAVGRIAEVIDGQAFLPEALHDIFIVWVSPAGGDVDHSNVFAGLLRR